MPGIKSRSLLLSSLVHAMSRHLFCAELCSNSAPVLERCLCCTLSPLSLAENKTVELVSVSKLGNLPMNLSSQIF